LQELNKIAQISKGETIKVLDIGAGSAWYWEEIANEITNFSLEVTLLDAVQLDSKLSRHQQLEFRRLVGTAPESLTEITANEFDLVVAFDLIEHLSKENGYKLLYEIDRISENSSMLFTPNGYVWQPPSMNNPFNAHISGWTPSELRKLGWDQLRGHTGLRVLREPYGLEKKIVKYWPMSELDALLKLASFRMPRFAFAYSAVKRVKNPRIDHQGF
jgi:ubiquinone/menaquinone biosynthesis C-methylase UbiE